ncbi:MAG: GSCFA domain-containing protein [Prevotellaceae bacterium]|nr:GSCFA domain-containing protein [Prevotellaceae bacterium]
MVNRKQDFDSILFRTPVTLPTPVKHFGVKHRYVFLGSCFAQHIGNRFVENRLSCLANPVGALYNPESIVRVITAEDAGETVLGPMGWHTWLMDTQHTRPSADEARQDAVSTLNDLRQAIQKADHLVITLGTTHTYKLLKDSSVVANCHKHPAREFHEHDLSLLDTISCLERLMLWLGENNKDCVITFSVSPYRYAKYGFHENQLSKATLLLAIHHLQQSFPSRIQYFPAYELMMDELRDYRFYDTDMLHPAAVAIDYIWQRLHEWMTSDLLDYLRRSAPLVRAEKHRPLDASSAAYQSFVTQNSKAWEKLRNDFSMSLF